MSMHVLEQLKQGDLFGGSIRAIRNECGDWDFVANDIAAILKIQNVRKTLNGLDEDEKGVTIGNTPGGLQKLNTVTLSGLFHLILISRCPEAKAFAKWVRSVVLPSLFKTGLYAGDAAGLAGALMTSRNYAQVRGLAGSVHGLGITAMAVCRRSGLSPALRRRRGHEFPVAALDKAAEGRPALRGPLAARPDGAVFFFDPAAAGRNGGEA